jgi:hypothetical protein
MHSLASGVRLFNGHIVWVIVLSPYRGAGLHERQIAGVHQPTSRVKRSRRKKVNKSSWLCPVQVDHPNCIKLYAVYITGRKVYIVTELVTGGELLDR